MKRALLLSLVALGGCTPGWLESGRYACAPDGGAEQCPGQWRCGLEGYCHQLGDTQVAWRCDTAADCEGNFVCGLSKLGEFRECHDPAAPQDWPCAGAGDCVAGWQCGWASPTTHQCHDPAAPQAWVCQVPGDCLGGWQCGLSAGGEARQCHDPAAPKAFLCESNSDCVGGWQCGLAVGRDHRECHDPAHPRAFACAEDADCLGGWRCGTDSSCVNPLSDALGTTPPVNLDGGAHLNSLVSTAPLTQLSISPFYSQAPGAGRGNLAWVQNGHLRARSLNTLTGAFIDYDLGTNLPTSLIAHGARGMDVTNPINPLPDQLERVTATWPDGGITTFTFADGGLDHAFDNPYYPSETLSHGTAAGDLTPSVFAYAAAPKGAYVLIRGDDWTAPYLAVEPFSGWTDFQDVPNNHIRGITSMRHDPALECVYLVDDRGLWVAQRSDEPDSWFLFEPVSFDRFTHLECGTGPQPRITSAQSVDARWLAVTATTASGPVQVAVLDAVRTFTDRAVPASPYRVYCTPYGDGCNPIDRVQIDVAYGPCVACPAGTTFESMNTVLGGPGVEPSLEVLCGQPNAAASVFRISRSGATSACARALVTGESSFFLERGPVTGVPAPGQLAFGGSAGQLWFGSNAADIASFTFDRAATGVVRRSARPDDILAFTPHLIGSSSAAAGLLSTRSTALSASVQHAPSLAVSSGQLIDLSGAGAISEARPLGFVGTGSLDARAAVLTRSSTGRRIALISSGATLYVGDVEDVLDASGPPVALTQRLSTGEPVSSLSFPEAQAPDAGPFAAGYAITGSNVVRVVADTSTRWRTEAVPLPVNLLPRATWFEGTRGRVGFHDGSVFSLPSRVRISSGLPSGAEAVDYAQACGQQLVLAPSGLFRLESSATGPVGQWVQVPLPPEVAALDFTEGRVHGVGNEVYVFTRLGEAARVTFEGCPP